MSGWNRKTLEARIRIAGQERYAAGSPDPAELCVYRKLLLKRIAGRDEGTTSALVLGMTPELRRLAVNSKCRLTSIDINPSSIELYRNWLTEDQQSRECIIEGNWLELTRLLDSRVDVILGDGIFGNLPDIASHRKLLPILAESIKPDGIVILRKILVPQAMDVSEYDAATLLDDFRSNRITTEEFAFGMRIWGCFSKAYDADRLLLDNHIVFETYDHWLAQGYLTESEHSLIQRYYFGGKNLLPPQAVWEELLTDAGFAFERQPLAGRTWYQYYPIYACRLAFPKTQTPP